MTFNIIIGIAILIGIVLFLKKEKYDKQRRFIEHYKFSPALLKRVQKEHEYLSDEDMLKVARATKDYFLICHMARGKMVAMPSEIVDVLWHNFILFTREYESFCKQGLGRFLHHVPTEAMQSKIQAQEGIKRAWRLACAKEDINPKRPTKLPLLFAIDKVLNIKGGFTYELDCKTAPHASSSNSSRGCGGYCATDINCTSGCVGESGNSSYDGHGGDGHSGGDSSCGGHSCGGGCGGN